MNQYHKIQTIFFRDPDDNHKTLLEGYWSKPEFEYLSDNKWIWTEKVDGTNIRVMFDDDEVVKFNGKTNNAEMHKDLRQYLVDTFSSQQDKFLEIFENPTDNPTAVCLYGEGYGAGIQKGGGKYQEEKQFVLFDVNIGGWWLQRKNVEDIAKQLGIDIVPIIGTGTLHEMVEKTRNGFASQWGDFIAEGIVARPETELIGRDGKRIITKIKYKDFIHLT